MSENLKDGDYTIEVTLSGGTGKAHIESPTKVYIENGEVQAEIIWNSSSYDYMEIDGISYYPVNDDGNSTFMIDVPQFDTDISILAETVAMSKPRMIEYTLNFKSDTLKSTNFSMLPFVCAGFAVITISVVVGLILKRKKKSNESNT